MRFDDRHVVVTAAANGIGRAIALRFAAAGARLTLIDLEAETLEDSRVAAARPGGVVDAVALDCRGDGVAAVFAAMEPVDVLINAVGSSARERSCEFRHSDPEVWRFVHEMSLQSALLCARQVVPGMCDRRRGRIVNITSDAALRPTARMAEYAAAKAGVIGFTRALAVETGPFGVTVNAVAPGLIQTRALGLIPEAMLETAKAEIPMGRTGDPDEIAAAVLFLAGDDAGYITGQTLAVNGGRNFL